MHREIDRAESAGLVTSRKIGNTRLVRANTDSPYYRGLADVLVKAFGPPRVLAAALAHIDNIDTAHIYGSWAARLLGASTDRAVGDIDVLVLGSPDRDEMYAAVSVAERRLGRPVQATVRPADWISTGTGNFHATVTQRPARGDPTSRRFEPRPAPALAYPPCPLRRRLCGRDRPHRIVMGDRGTVRVVVLGAVAHPAEALERRLRERFDCARKLG